MSESRSRAEALQLLNGAGAILDVAREVTRILENARIEGAIIGGVATVLHGHIRTTIDVDVYVPTTQALGDALKSNGYKFDKRKREFIKGAVPVHLVLPEQTGTPREFVNIDDIRTVSLADLINMKLRSGTKSITRAQDIADVIGLIRVRKLTGQFASKIGKDLRPEFRRLVKAIEADQN